MSVPLNKAIVGGINILLTGGSGRIGSELVKSLTASGHSIYQIKRGDPTKNLNPLNITVVDPASLTLKEWKNVMERNGIQLVLNLAAQSSGDLKSMLAVNVNMTEEMAKASNELNIPMVHTCSHSAELQGINLEEHPYAATKKMAAEALKEYPNVVIARLGAVLGGKSDVPVVSDAAVSPWSPFIILPSEGGEQVFHPVDEKTVIETLEKIVNHLSDPSKKAESLPRTIDIAGQEVPLKAFLKMVNPKALASVKLPQPVLDLLAVLVDKGVFTKEFMKISKLTSSQDAAAKPDTSAMESILGVEPPSPEKVAQEASKRLSVMNTSSIVSKAFFKKVSKSLPKGIWPPKFATNVKVASGLALAILIFSKGEKEPTQEEKK